MHRKRREGWIQHCPLSYNQSRCMHPPFVECYAVQAFSIASNYDPKLMPKEQDKLRWEKFAPSFNPLFRVTQITIRATARITRNTTCFSPFVTFWLVWTLVFLRHFLRCCWCSDCGSGWLFLLRVELSYVTKLFAASTARPSALHHYHYLPIPSDDGFWNGLKTFPR